MSSFEPVGPAASPQGRNASVNPNTARSGVARAIALQSTSTTKSAAPVATTQAVVQTQASEKSRMDTPAPPKHSSPLATPLRPITAVLLHELRLQQELSDVHETLEKSSG